MRYRVLFVGIAMLGMVMTAAWVAPTSASQPEQKQAAAAPSAEKGTCEVGPDGRRLEFCVVNYCSVQPGKICQYDSGTKCEDGNCRYKRVNGTCDPGWPGPPSCATGCN